ncbi:MAG TPA: TlpA disulfide reductase family protein [Acidimicrobiales bacterium]|nr:TlpA disulfide reductase family protein [Acidimicrobiales bacterium]
MTDVRDDAPAPDDDAVAGGGDDLDSGVDAPRHRRSALAISLAVALLVAGFVVVLATREPAINRRSESDRIGKVAPELVGQTLDGGSFDIDKHLGRWVVVNFFATWCRPCVVEHPELDAFQREHAESGDAVVVSILYDDDADEAQQFFADRGGDWPVVLDDSGLAAAYGVTGVPETYLVAPSGRVAVKLTGGVTRDGLNGYIQEIEAMAGADEVGG